MKDWPEVKDPPTEEAREPRLRVTTTCQKKTAWLGTCSQLDTCMQCLVKLPQHGCFSSLFSLT